MALDFEMISQIEPNKNVSLQSFDQKRDHALLVEWINSPHIIQWWGDPAKNIREFSEPAIGGGEALIMVGSIPVGYIRWQVPSQEELREAGLDDLPESTVDIDIAIGETNYLGCGIASQSLRLLVSRLLNSKKVPMIMICTSVNNSKAIKSFESAGFRRDRIFDDPEYGRMWLLTNNGEV